MALDHTGRWLELLTRLGHRLPQASSTADACEEVTAAFSALGIAVCATVLEGDNAKVVAIQVPDKETGLTSATASRLAGMRVPIDGIDCLRHPVRLRRPYLGRAGAVQTLRSVSTDSGLSYGLPQPWDEDDVVAVPVTANDRVLAVITVWGDAVCADMVPPLEAAAAMLASALRGESDSAFDRFTGVGDAGASDEELRGELLTLLDAEQLSAAVQPIVRLYDSTIIGYEALTRFPPRQHIRTPDQLFSAASTFHMDSTVDQACMRAALREAANLGDADFFINVLIRTLHDSKGMRALHTSLRAAGVDPSSVVLEFSERDPVPDLAKLQRIAADLRSHGFRIAVDDAGSGHASMRVIAELRPEFIKVDRSLIHAIDNDRARRALVVSLLSFSGHIGARLIAEGIETAAENETLQSLGVQFGQGWHLGRPVLMQPVKGHAGTEVVDAHWFASRPVSRIRDPRDARSQQRPPEPKLPSPAARRRRRGLARALSDAALALQSEHDPRRILSVMAEHMARVVPVREMAIMAANYETHRFIPVLATGEEVEEILADSFSLDAGITGWAFALGTPQNIPDTASHPQARQVPGTAVVKESLLAIPLVAGERKLGIINCWRMGVHQFSDRELEAASLFAHVAASAWRNAQLYTELMDAAMTDPLTGLYNSRWLRDTVARDLTRCERDGSQLAILLVDLDHFKSVNDNGGHAAGDMVLQRVAMRLRSSVRGSDAVVRLGGEEFVLLLHGCDTAHAFGVAEAVRQTLRESTLPESCGVERITASIGVAVHPEHGTTLDQLLAAADRAMYEAKHAGRDRVIVAGPRPAATVLSLRERQPQRVARASGA